MIVTLKLDSRFRAQIGAEASVAFPRECCGLIEGTLEGSVAQVLAIHPARNLAAEDDRFEIDPAAHIALLRRLRGSGREIIGCYHSHPNGCTEPSARDRESACDSDFLWLIVANDAHGEIGFAAFRFGQEGPKALRLVGVA